MFCEHIIIYLFLLEVPNVFTVLVHKLPYSVSRWTNILFITYWIIWKEQKIIAAQFNTISKAYLKHSQHFGFTYYTRMFNWLYIQYSVHLWAQTHSYINCDTKIFHSKSLKSKIIPCRLVENQFKMFLLIIFHNFHKIIINLHNL